MVVFGLTVDFNVVIVAWIVDFSVVVDALIVAFNEVVETLTDDLTVVAVGLIVDESVAVCMGQAYLAVDVTVFVPQPVAQELHTPAAVEVTVMVVGHAASGHGTLTKLVIVAAADLQTGVEEQTGCIGQFTIFCQWEDSDVD